MEFQHQPPSVILRLMGLDKVPLQCPVRDKQKVLSENYLQKVASIGVRKKRACHLNHVVGMDTDEKEEFEEGSKVVKAIRRDIHHNPSKGNGKENSLSFGKKVKGEPQLLLNTSVNCQPKKLVDTFNSFNDETSVNSGRKSERGDLQLQQKMDNGLQNNVFREAGLYDTFRISESRSDLKDETFNSRIGVLKANPGNSHLSDGLFREIFYLKSMRIYPEIRDRKKISHHMNFGNQSSRSVGRGGQGSTHHQLPMIPGHGNGARNLSYQSHIGNDKITKDSLFQKYWGLRANTHAKWSTRKAKNQNINQKDCSEDMNLSSSSEKSPSFSSYFNSNHNEENCIDMHKSKMRCHGDSLSDKKPMLPQLSRSGPCPAFAGNEVLQETGLKNCEVMNNKHEDMSKQDVVSPDSSIDCLVSDAKSEFIGKSHNDPTKHQPTPSILSHESTDSLSHTSYASTQQDTSEIQEGSVYSLYSGADPDSLGSFEEAYKPSPISVLDPSFGEGISFISKCGSVVYDSSEADYEGSDLNVSSDEDCGDESVGDFEEKNDIVGLFRTEESRDFSYVVEVLTEASISNTSLFTDFSTWHSAECPISPSVFEILEKKFGEQQFWKRSERRLLFDRINLSLLEILQPYLYVPMWEKPVSRRLNGELLQDMIEEEIWGLIVAQEKKAGKEKADDMLGGGLRWIELGEDIEDFVREIVKLLIEDLANEIVSLENF